MSHLQYEDDPLFIAEACMEYLLSTKALLKSFKLMSGLKINFSKKSRLFRFNVNQNFLEVATGFINCKAGKFPFI